MGGDQLRREASAGCRVKILLFGKTGQVGWELQRSLSPLGEVIALDSRDTGLCGDFNNPEGIANTVAAIRPDVIVNAAAYTAVDKAETDVRQAQAINAIAPAILAKSAAACGAWFIHYSTDYVFDGTGKEPWSEGDPTAPLNVYGSTKLEGERLVAANCARHLILRTSWVFAARGGNFAKTMLRLAKERDELTVIDDQFGAPTGAEMLADVTAQAIPQLRVDESKAGIYHVAAGGVTTWHEYARFIIARARVAGVAIRCADEAIRPVPATSFPTPARRPANSRLDTRRFQKTFSLSLAPWQQG
ncbi:MAG: dTDP-4-dehydrorhamnose reductase, partial [Comamonadaceae bacterium]